MNFQAQQSQSAVELKKRMQVLELQEKVAVEQVKAAVAQQRAARAQEDAMGHLKKFVESYSAFMGFSFFQAPSGDENAPKDDSNDYKTLD